MPYAYRFALPVPALALMLAAVLSALSLAAVSPCLPSPFGCG